MRGDLVRDCEKSLGMQNCNKERCQSLELNPICFVTVIVILSDTWYIEPRGSHIISEISVACDENEFCFKFHKQIKGDW